MRAFLTITLGVVLTGCAQVYQPEPQQRAASALASSYNAGYEAGRETMLYELKHDPRISVTYYALGPCKTFRAWMPPKGDITAERWWKAILKERDLKKACAARHHALREQVKFLLGVIDDYE